MTPWDSCPVPSFVEGEGVWGILERRHRYTTAITTASLSLSLSSVLPLSDHHHTTIIASSPFYNTWTGRYHLKCNSLAP